MLQKKIEKSYKTEKNALKSLNASDGKFDGFIHTI